MNTVTKSIHFIFFTRFHSLLLTGKLWSVNDHSSFATLLRSLVVVCTLHYISSMVQTRAQTRAQTAILRDQEVPDGMMVLEDLPKKKALSKQAVLPKEPLVEGWVLDQRKTVASGGYTSNVSFMALPPEIRNIIYELVLVRDGYFSIYCRLESKDDESRNFCTGWVERINMRSFLLSNSILTFAGTAARDSANLTSPFQILYRPGYGAEHSKPNYNLLIVSPKLNNTLT